LSLTKVLDQMVGRIAMAKSAARIAALTQLILDQVGASPDWQVASITSSGAGDGCVIEVALAVGGRPTGGTPVFTGIDVTDDRAVSAFVDQVYTVLIEESGGTLMRFCPGHGHPSWPVSSEGNVLWVCLEAPRASLGR